jgi:hypothetical protein
MPAGRTDPPPPAEWRPERLWKLIDSLESIRSEMAGLECVLIDEDTKLRELKKELRWNEAYYYLAKGIG